jgi:hypothetical protein
MIYKIELPPDELGEICKFMRGELDEIPEVSELGTKILDRLTREQKGLWHISIGNFVEFRRLGDRSFHTPMGNEVSHADALMDEVGGSTGRYGTIQTDFVNPEGVFETGVPI